MSPRKVLSPHLSIYAPQISSVLSIFHRVTGSLLVMACILGSAVMLAGVTLFTQGECTPFFVLVMAWMPWGLKAVGFSVCWTFAYHIVNGFRHMAWDLGWGFANTAVARSGQVMLVVSGACAVGLMMLLNNVVF